MNLITLTVLLVSLNLIAAADNKCSANFWTTQLEQLESYIDETVEPCDDFYEYACGNWRAPYQLRALHARDAITAVKADNKRQLMKYFLKMELTQQLDELPSHKRALVNFYNSCLDNHVKMEKNDTIRIYTDTLQQFSDWPILNAYFLESDTNATFNWEHISAQLRRYGVQTFWRLMVQPNWQAAEQKIFYIAPPQFEFLKAHKQSEAADADSEYLYKRYVKYLMLDLGVRVREAIKIAEEVVDFEKQLLLLVRSERSLVLQEPQPLETLVRALSDVSLRKYFDTVMLDFDIAEDYAKELLIVADEAYLRKVGALLKRTKTETIGKYLLVQFLAHFEVHLHEDDTFSEQKENCLQRLHDFMPLELSSTFLELEHENAAEFMQRTQKDLNVIFEKLKVQFEKMLNATNVFDRDAVTKILGLEKLRAMRLLLPNLEKVASALDLEIDENYDKNLMNLSKLSAKAQLAEVLQTISASTLTSQSTTSADSSYGPLDVNAFYRLKKNAIELPVGILRTPFYDACLLNPKIYGSFVYIIAHELLHGFDYDGLNYDKSGNVANNWGVKSIIKFGTKSTCYFSERYTNAPLTINENIADSEGLRLALETFQESVYNTDESKVTASQQDLKLFFISFAQTWCGANALNTNSLHAGHRERVNNVVSNFAEFAETFKCKVASEMNPEEKCRIW